MSNKDSSIKHNSEIVSNTKLLGKIMYELELPLTVSESCQNIKTYLICKYYTMSMKCPALI